MLFAFFEIGDFCTRSQFVLPALPVRAIFFCHVSTFGGNSLYLDSSFAYSLAPGLYPASSRSAHLLRAINAHLLRWVFPLYSYDSIFEF